jgi:DNA-binding CsgD family transcriptional regulator
VTRTVVGRLRRLAPEALEVARGLAVLGERAQLAQVAELSGLDAGAVRSAHATLVRVGLVDAERLRFVHPLVQEAVAADLVGGERSALHRRAARLLAAAGAGDDEVAVHLMRADPEGDAWTASVLADAGAKALCAGAPDAAARLLARALDEPPPPPDAPAVHLSLGIAEASMGAPAAMPHLDAAVAGGDAVTAAKAAAVRANRLIIAGRADEAADSLRAPLEAVAPVDAALADQLRDLLLDALPYRYDLLDEHRERVEAGAAEGRPAALAHLAWLRASAGGPRDEVVALARRALESGELIRGVVVERFTPFYAVEALHVVEAADEAAAALRDAREEARAAGSRAGLTALAFVAPQWDRLFGDLRRAEAELREQIELTGSPDAGGAHVALHTLLVGVLLDRGEVEEADRFAAHLPAAEGQQFGAIGLHAARGRLRLEQRRYEEALADLERQFALERRRGSRVTNREPAHALAVRALAALGRADDARALADEELALARERGNAAAEAVVRLARAGLAEGDEALAELRRAVEAARRSPSRIVRAQALAELGSALRRAGRRSEAREPLREARELAHQCGATGLERRTHEELVVAGARPQRVALSGLDALTAAERRAAELAAQGMRNREIAETLFVTLKTVEVHLGRSYAKLGIHGRSQLPQALGLGG